MNLLQAEAIPFVIAVYGYLTQDTAQMKPRGHRKDAKIAKGIPCADFASLRCRINLVIAIHG